MARRRYSGINLAGVLMATADWRAIFTATARAEGKTLREWLADCDRQAAEMVATIPPYLRKPPLLPRPDAA